MPETERMAQPRGMQQPGGSVAPGIPQVRVAILISGRGSNLQSMAQIVVSEHLPVQICSVLSNRPDAAGLTWAREHGLPTDVLPHRNFACREDFDAALQRRLEQLAPDYILLAGFMRVLGADLVRRFQGRIINIHPSLLPAFPGLHTHAQALVQGVQWHGCTVHFVTPELDHGPIIAQGIIPVLSDDTPDRLAQRLLPVEHRVYGQVLRWLAQRRVHLQSSGVVQIDGEVHRAWLGDTQFHAQDSHAQK